MSKKKTKKSDGPKLIRAAAYKPKYGKEASHRTESTRKYQCNAPLTFEAALRAIMKREKFTREGEAIRFALAKGLGIKLAAEE
jgi:hypothetical protein